MRTPPFSAPEDDLYPSGGRDDGRVVILFNSVSSAATETNCLMTEVNVFQHSEHLFGVGRITTYNFPQMAAKLCALNPFFGRDDELQIYHGNFLLMDNTHRKFFVIKQSKGCKIILKCISVLQYADDILLIAPSVTSLQQLLNICEQELEWLDMSLNAKKV